MPSVEETEQKGFILSKQEKPGGKLGSQGSKKDFF
jgi:hypothetical protein